MAFIKVDFVFAQAGMLRVGYEISPELEPYFTAERIFEVEYSEDISTVPESVLVIPFVCNVLPLVWLTDAVLELPELDKEFYEGIPGVLEGYRNMSPMLEFKGAVRAEKLVDNCYTPTEKTAAFFSGGVDAFATLVAHADEKPQLITLWGADVKLTDTDGWKRVNQHAVETSREYGLITPLLVRSNFRLMENEGALGQLVAASGDGWWHGYQHGIALIGHAAPFAYLNHWKTVYIASSYTPGIKTICASDPTIDNQIRLTSTQVWHDQYECSRQMKVRHIVEYCMQSGHRIQLRVCWITEGGTNCCVCEKCIRTITAILAENANPADYGFADWSLHRSLFAPVVRYTLHSAYHLRLIWQDIQDRYLETQAYRQDKLINWIYSLDVNNPLTWQMRLKDMVRNRLPQTARMLRFIKRKFWRHYIYR